MVILFGILFFIGTNKSVKTSGIVSEELTPEKKDILKKELELKEILLDYDKNFVEVVSLLESNNNELTQAHIVVVGKEKIVNEGELLLFISENLNLSTEKIDMVYMDVETFTSAGTK